MSARWRAMLLAMGFGTVFGAVLAQRLNEELTFRFGSPFPIDQGIPLVDEGFNVLLLIMPRLSDGEWVRAVFLFGLHCQASYHRHCQASYYDLSPTLSQAKISIKRVNLLNTIRFCSIRVSRAKMSR